jgi:hypothetical protein
VSDMIGRKYGSIEVMAYSHKSTSGSHYWLCKCACGNEKLVQKSNLESGRTKSCGCEKGERISQRRLTHGLTRTRVHTIWTDMKQRCLNPNAPDYPRYGGRGIKLCQAWHSFDYFYEDMGEPPEGTTLNRINNDGDYEPGNCEWAAAEIQQNNRRTSRRILHMGFDWTLAQWSRYSGTPARIISWRIEHGWSVKAAIFGMVAKRTKRTFAERP